MLYLKKLIIQFKKLKQKLNKLDNSFSITNDGINLFSPFVYSSSISSSFIFVVILAGAVNNSLFVIVIVLLSTIMFVKLIISKDITQNIKTLTIFIAISKKIKD